MTHFGDIVLDEIALEGLDGITLSALWTRLEARLNIEDICYGRVPVSEETYGYIWEICRDVPSIFAYVLPAPRPQLVIFDRFACVDEETEVPYEPTRPIEDIYPVKSIEDKVTGNRGSCAEYYTRIEVTQEIRNMTFEQVSQKWGNSLVLVASQTKRNRALLGPNWNPTFILHINAYLMVERIGRARYLGELSVGKSGLGALNMPLKSSHYYRKPLLKHNLVTKQGFFSRNTQGKLVSCLLLHITRFYIEYIPNLMLDYIHLVKHLKTIPNHIMLAEDARSQVSRPLKKMLKFPGLKKHVLSIERVLYRSVHPDASEEDYSFKGKLGEKTITVLRLVEPDVREQDLLKTPDEGEEMEDGEDDDEGVEGILDMTRIVQNYRMSLGRIAYQTIREAGSHGLSQTELGNKLGLSKLDSRTILRYLTKHKIVNLVTLQVKRQKIVMYIAPIEKENPIPTDVEPSIPGTSIYQRPKPPQKKSKQVTKSLPISDISLMQGAINAHLEDETAELEVGDLTKSVDLETEGCEAESALEEGIVVAESMANDVLVTETMHAVYQRCKERVAKTWDAVTDDKFITNSKRERLDYLLKIINQQSIISGSGHLRHEIIKHEEQSGKSSYGTICKRTLWSLLAELELKGEISIYFFIISGSDKQNFAEFICKKGVTKEHPEIRSVLEHNSLKLGTLMRKPGAKKSAITELEEGLPRLKRRRRNSDEEALTISSSRSTKAARQHGYEPKCIRMQILHNYLFYLAHDYRGKTDLDQVSSFEKLLELHDIDEDLAKTLPILYCDTVCPEMFVQPLPEYKDYKRGWILVGDIITRMPLSIFLKLVNTNYEIPGIFEYIRHPVKRNLPISCLPKKITKYLLFARKYLFSMHYNLENLCFAGLIQFGPSLMKGKDQIMVYVNKHACIKDTMTTPPGFLYVDQSLVYETRTYIFEKVEDLYKYWEDLNFVARGTLLGSYEGMEGKMIEMTELKKKPGIICSLDSKTNEEAPANDLGIIPGDSLGACGFDSAFFIHLRRNWTFVSNMPTEGEVGRYEQNTTKKKVKQTEELTEILPSVKPEKEGEKGRRGKSKVIKKKGKSQTIIVSGPIKRKRMPVYDEKDQISLANMTSLRVDWSEKEDEALTLAQAVSCYIYPNNRNVRVPGVAIRDVLHKVLPEIAKNKTSRACTRRILFLVKKQPLLFSEANLLTDELSCDPEIIEKYPPIADFPTKVGGIEKKNLELCRRFNDLFIDLYSRLEERPISMLTMLLGSSVSLPNTLGEFYNHYEIFTPVTRSLCTHKHKEVENEYDVTQFSLQAVIFSTYMNNDKMSRTRQLLDIYQLHTDDVMREAFKNFKSSGVLSATKKRKRSDKTAALRANLDYRLSVRLIHQLRGKCQSDFFATIDADAFKSKNIRSVYENSSEVSHDEYTVVGQKESGLCTIYAAADPLFNFKSIVEIPDELIVLNPDQFPKTGSVEETIKELEGILVKTGMAEEKARSILESEKLDYQKSTGKQEMTPVGRVTVRNNIQEEYVPILLTDSVSIIYETRKDTNLVTRLVNATAKHLCLSTDRGLTSGKNDARDVGCDLFVLRACRLKVNMLPHEEKDLPPLPLFIDDGELKSSKKCQMTATVTKKLNFEAMVISKSRVKLMKGEINDQFEEFTEEELNVALEVVAYLTLKEAVGATKPEISEEFYSITKPELAKIVVKLLHKKLIYKVGSVCVRYVSYKFATKWAVLTYHLKRQDKDKLPSLNPEKANQMSDISEPPSKRKRFSEEVVVSKEKQKSSSSHDKFFVILRPWIRVDGSLNRSGLSFMLLSVLSHIMDRPGTTMTEIAEYFLPSLANIVTYDLIEMLEEMYCVTRYVVMKQPVSLFSKRSLIHEIRPVDELDLENEVRVEATAESAVKLALLMHGSFSSHTSYKCPCH